MKTFRDLLLLLVIAITLSSCSSIGPTVKIGVVRFPDEQTFSPEVRARVIVGEFGDRRTERSLAIIDSERLYPAEDLAKVTKWAFESRLYQDGGMPINLGTVTINGDLIELRAQGIKSFPMARLRARAKIEVAFQNPGGKIVYRAIYTGEVEQTLPVIRESNVQEVLRDALAAAVIECFNDSKVKEVLREAALK